ncbi:cyclin-D4-1-like [Cornus florida]|uniref:cyclin-D4-1-like n=1 Tax=Cornus florida TaxID=4283 RepID=UPI00289CE6A7|nr:cyclin-D4-1-like [Cornus florida]
MADSSFDCAASNLLCTETNKSWFDDLDSVATDDQTHQTYDPNMVSGIDRSEPLMGLPLLSDESFDLLADRERMHLPRDDYLKRLRTGELDLGVRREAFDWILKAHAHYSFGPLSACLSMNYLDRFLSVYELPRGKTWTVQLLAVACLSLATKMEETKVPITVDLQVGEPKYVFEGKTIQRMELLVLNTLNWRMQACTPCSFIDYFLRKINGTDQLPSGPLISRSIRLILTTIKGIDFLEFRPCEIAAAVALSISGEIKAVNIDKAMSCFMHLEKGRVLKCVELIQDLILNSGGWSNVGTGGNGTITTVPQSPNGVLEVACFSLSYKSDDMTVGSCANSSSQHHNSPNSKRRKFDVLSQSQVDNKS